MKKNKTLAAWLAFLGGPFGLHRMYLYGLTDTVAWLHPIPTALGLYGIQRVQQYGQDDQWSWVLIPLFGFTFAITALHAIVYGLMAPENWNARFNPSIEPGMDPEAAAQAAPGQTNWLTIGAIVLSLLLGTTVLMASIAFSFQRYFEYQIDESRKISQ